jgi:hypothetical protein
MADRTGIEWTDATGRALGVLKTAAKRAGVSLDEYRSRVERGDKYCWACRAWHQRHAFALDASRSDGLTALCREARSAAARSKYSPKARKRLGWIAAVRDGDRQQARRRINYLVEQKLIPSPAELPCMDCGDGVFAADYRHEYDHARGYDGDSQLYVEPVCSKCHHNREDARRG